MIGEGARTRRGRVHDLPALRNRRLAFGDREEGGEVLAGMLARHRESDAIVLAIAPGGMPVAAVVADHLRLPLDISVVADVHLPDNDIASLGAVAWDGTSVLDPAFADDTRLERAALERALTTATRRVARRMVALRAGRRPLDLSGRCTILVDDGIATDAPMRAACAAIAKLAPSRIVVGAPTGHAQVLSALAEGVDAVYCPNVLGGWRYAVADAYRRWWRVDEARARALLRGAARYA